MKPIRLGKRICLREILSLGSSVSLERDCSSYPSLRLVPFELENMPSSAEAVMSSYQRSDTGQPPHIEGIETMFDASDMNVLDMSVWIS